MRRRSLVLNSIIAAAALAASAFVGGASSQAATDGGFGPYDPAHAGGTIKLVAQAAAGSLDPKINYTGQYWQLYQADGAGRRQ